MNLAFRWGCDSLYSFISQSINSLKKINISRVLKLDTLDNKHYSVWWCSANWNILDSYVMFNENAHVWVIDEVKTKSGEWNISTCF